MRIASVLDENNHLGCQTAGAQNDLELPWRLSQTLGTWDTMQIAKLAKHLPRVPSEMLKWRVIDTSAADQIQAGL